MSPQEEPHFLSDLFHELIIINACSISPMNIHKELMFSNICQTSSLVAVADLHFSAMWKGKEDGKDEIRNLKLEIKLNSDNQYSAVSSVNDFNYIFNIFDYYQHSSFYNMVLFYHIIFHSSSSI